MICIPDTDVTKNSYDGYTWTAGHKKREVCVTYVLTDGGARGVIVIVVGNSATRVQILDLTDCISHSANTLGKGMNPIILPPAMGK